MELPAQNPITLQFRSEELEEAFRAEYVRRSLRQVRHALLLGIAIYGLVFGVIDYLRTPGLVTVTWTIRGAVCAFAFAVLALTYTPSLERYMQPALSVLLAVGGSSIVLMLALDPSRENYLGGPVLMLLATYVVVRLRFTWASLAGGIIVAAYMTVAAGLKNLAPSALASSSIFVVSANVIGMFAGYMLEDYARRQFWQARVIDEKRAENAELLEARSRFFASVSHELRTPLTLILGPLDDLLSGNEEPAVPDRLHRPLGRMQRSARRLLRLIGQLLDLAKLEAGGLQLRMRQTALAPFLRGVTRSFKGHARHRGIDLQFSADAFTADTLQRSADERMPYIDLDKLEKVMANLLSNAFKFTPEGGTVRVSVEKILLEKAAGSTSHENGSEDNAAALIRVRDTGPGIPPEELPRLFDRFYQAENSRVRQQEGTGIGLAFAKELVEMHGGQIAVESELGFGTEFTVTLPLGRAHLRSEEIIEANDEKSKRAWEALGASDRALEEQPAGQEESEGAPGADEDQRESENTGEAATVLVVEDNADVRAYVRDALTGTYDVREAAGGEEGVDVARAVVPDLIVTDVMMPELDGYAFCRALKGDAVLDHIPVVMLTAKVDPEHRIEGLEAGADAYLGKPFSQPELQAQVDSLLTSRRRFQERFSQDALTQPSEVDVQSADERFIQRAREAVEEQMGDADFDVETFAGAVGMSRRQLQRKLRAVADQTPSAFVRLIRLRRGAQLLAQEYGTVSEIAYTVGFGSPSYFTKCFRETFGTTPSQYEPDTQHDLEG